MKIAFRADNDLDRDIVRGLLRLQPDIHFEAEPLNDLSEAVVTGTDPAALHSLRRNATFPGVIVTPQSYPTGEAIERLHMLWVLTDANEWHNRICYLPTFADFVI
ncbi:MAG TPA: hypothetical protein VGM43_15560 [Bryobacteraceae bacterium]